MDLVLVAVEVKFARPSFPSVVNFGDGHHSDLLSLCLFIRKKKSLKRRKESLVRYTCNGDGNRHSNAIEMSPEREFSDRATGGCG